MNPFGSSQPRRALLKVGAALGIGLGVLAALLLVLAGVLLWTVPTSQPSVLRTEALAQDDVERALQLARSHDPRHAIPGVVRTLRLSQHEAELLLNHAAARVRPSRWALQFDAERLKLQDGAEMTFGKGIPPVR